MWLLDAPESMYHREDREEFLPEMPKAEKAWIIICWIIWGVTGATPEEDGCESMDDEDSDTTEVVLEDEATGW